MRAVVQRIESASVEVENRIVGKCGPGLLVYLGVGMEDTKKDVKYLADKVVNLRIFSDELGKMNRSVHETQGSILVVSQFTLYADARKGRRPSYNQAADPEQAKIMYESFLHHLTEEGIHVVSGIFQATMKVMSRIDGPVTILLDSRKKF